MTTLEQFLEPIEFAGESLGDKHRAYRMDGNRPKPDMRRDAGLGTCNCCDYFMFAKDDIVVLIEETQLMRTIERLKSKYRYLQSSHQTEFVYNYIREENKLKVYGSMLVLCRLAAACKNTNHLLRTKKYKFWLVASGMNEPEHTRVFDNLKDRLFQDLRSVLTGKVMDDVEIIPSDRFASKLVKHAATS